jgi:hypothetical protein
MIGNILDLFIENEVGFTVENIDKMFSIIERHFSGKEIVEALSTLTDYVYDSAAIYEMINGAQDDGLVALSEELNDARGKAAIALREGRDIVLG